MILFRNTGTLEDEWVPRSQACSTKRGEIRKAWIRLTTIMALFHVVYLSTMQFTIPIEFAPGVDCEDIEGCGLTVLHAWYIH